MDKLIKQEWIKALRSGEYNQVRGFLNIDSRYCCLGVLCELAAKELICSKKEGINYAYFDTYHRQLPISVRDWAQLNPQLENQLTCLNDDRKLSFNEIANWIEDNL